MSVGGDEGSGGWIICTVTNPYTKEKAKRAGFIHPRRRTLATNGETIEECVVCKKRFIKDATGDEEEYHGTESPSSAHGNGSGH